MFIGIGLFLTGGSSAGNPGISTAVELVCAGDLLACGTDLVATPGV